MTTGIFETKGIDVTTTAANHLDVLPSGAWTRVSVQNQGNVAIWIRWGDDEATADKESLRVLGGAYLEIPVPVRQKMNLVASAGTQPVHIEAM